MIANRIERFPLAPDALPNMACGVNGMAFEQIFRPQYFTAEWKNGSLADVRIWGQRVLKDGSLGKRHLDHRWKQSPAGPVRLADLPAPVAQRLREFGVVS